MNGPVETIYTHGKLLLSIVSRGLGDKVVAITKRAGARGGTVLMGRGTAESSMMAFLGLGDSSKDIVFTLATDDRIGRIVEAIETCNLQDRHKAGISILLDVPHILKHVVPGSFPIPPSERSHSMNQPSHTLIVFIVNNGYADDAMAAARKAGATGGTILHARGTGKEEDVKFFGLNLVPEKEILLILEENGKAQAILEAIQSVECFREPGAGIAFCLPAERFIPLGRP